MGTVKYTNNAATTLASGINTTVTTLTVNAGDGALFPDTSTGDHFYITLEDGALNREIVKVTTRATDTFTIERGADGTSGTAFIAGDKAELRACRIVLDEIGSNLDGIGTPTYTNLQDWNNTTQSAGAISGGNITDAGSGTIDVSDVKGIFKTTNSAIGENVFFDLTGLTGQALTDSSINYIAVDYNSGTPQFVVGVTSVANGHTIFNLGKVYREGTSLDIIDSGLRIYDIYKKIQQHHVEEGGLHFVTGAVIGETGTRNVTISAGVMYAGLNRLTTDAVDTSGADTFEYYYYDGAAWQESDVSQIDNLQYNNVASGLVTLANNHYGAHWVYKGTNGDSYIVYGQGDYTLSEAQTVQPPSSLPDHVSEMGVLRGKIIIKKSAAAFTEIQSVADTQFTAATPSNHNELANIDGGAADEYYHLTNTQHTNLTTYNFDGAVTINETGADVNFRVESDTDANAFMLDGTTGNIGIGNVASVDDKIAMTYNPENDSGASAIHVNNGVISTVTGSYNNTGMVLNTSKNVSAGVTDSGRMDGIRIVAYSNGDGDSTLTRGLYVTAGKYSGTGTATDVHVLRVLPQHRAGTVTNLHAIRIDDATTGGTATNPFAIYSDWDAPSYFKGDLGIGVDSPASALHLYSATENKQIRVESLNTVGTASIQLRGDTAITQLKTNGSAAVGGLLNEPNRTALQATGDGGISLVAQHASGVIVLGTGGQTERMRIDADGNVGIGTSSPDQVLHTYKTSGGNYNHTETAATSDVGVKFTNASGSAYVYKDVDDLILYNTVRAITIDTSGNVGIGTSSPATKLHLSDVSTPTIRLQDTTNNAYSEISSNDAAALIIAADAGGTSANSFMSFRVDGAAIGDEAVRIDANGNVGIGTTSPSAALEVAGNHASNITVIKGYNKSTAGYGASLELGGGYSGGYSMAKLETENHSTGGVLKIQTADTSKVLVTRLSIDNVGNVGIGTTSPDKQLHLYRNDTDTTNGQIIVEQDGTGDASIEFYATAVTRWMVGLDNSDDDKFKISGSGSNLADNTRLTIDTVGNVGIGTNSPAIDLHVKADGPGIQVEDDSGPITRLYSGDSSGFVGTMTAHPFEIRSGGNPYVYILNNGDVGIGRTPTTNDLEVEGTASKTASGDWLANSDRRIKKNIKPIENALDTIKKLNPVTFQYTDDYQSKHKVGDKTYWNFIAQEYQEVFPESVKGSGEMLDNKEILQMESGSAQVVAIKAIQELTKRIEQLEKKLS